MDNPRSPGSPFYAVSRSRGKHAGESNLTARARERRKLKGLARSSDESEPEDELEPGAVILHQLYNRKVILYPDNTVVKMGRRIAIGEADALRVASLAGIPAPCVHDAHRTSDGMRQIRMSYIQGQSLDKLWANMSAEERKDIARQLREIVKKMRSLPPPPHLIGACDGAEIRDTRQYFTYCSPPCRDENAFNEYLISSLYDQAPPLLREAFSRGLRTDHRIVLSHCDLAPRNIMVQNGKIQGLVDWEDAGWYPEYWEYVKFFQRPADSGWKQYAEDIFPKLYHDELVRHIAMSRYQTS